MSLVSPLSPELGDALRAHAARTGTPPSDLRTYEVAATCWIGAPYRRAELRCETRGALFVLARPQRRAGGLGPAIVLGEIEASGEAERVEEHLELTAEARERMHAAR